MQLFLYFFGGFSDHADVGKIFFCALQHQRGNNSEIASKSLKNN